MRILPMAVLCAASLFADVNPEWKKPFPAHKIVSNIYYVGTADLACYLITTPQGHILINTGLVDSTPLLREGIEKVGFKMSDIKILLTMQAHYDHVAAMAEVKKLTGAKLYATVPDAPFLEDGAHSDPSFGKTGWFTPTKVDRLLKDGDSIQLGGTELKVVMTPGHTKGSVSYAMTVDDNGKKRQVLFVNMLTAVMPLVHNKFYPRIVEDIEASFARQQQQHPDIWLAGHASQYDMEAKSKTGNFVDPEGYKQAVARSKANFEAQLAKERKEAGVTK